MVFSAQKIMKGVLLFFVFMVSFGAVFWGVQWFSSSVKDLLENRHSFGLQSYAADNAEASVESVSAIPQNIFPAPLEPQLAPAPAPLPEAALSIKMSSDQEEVLFSQDENKKLPVASLTKLMVALVTINQYDLAQKITVSASAMAEEGEQGELKEGQVLSVKDLLYITLMESSNRASSLLSEVMGREKFIKEMNDRALAMGLLNTRFEDATGLDPKNYSTARDIVALSKYLFENYPLFREIIGLKKYDLYLDDGTLHHALASTNQLLGQHHIVGGKTGFTNSAKGCFMTIQTAAMPPASGLMADSFSNRQDPYVINVVLGAEDRFGEMEKIISQINF